MTLNNTGIRTILAIAALGLAGLKNNLRVP